MRHALMYAGGFERNFPTLTPTTTAFEGSDGQLHPYAPWPASVDGCGSATWRGRQEVRGVRVADGQSDVVLRNEMVLVPGAHFGFGARLSAEPTLVEDNIAMLTMLEDIIKKNAEVSEELLLIRARFKAGPAASRRLAPSRRGSKRSVAPRDPELPRPARVVGARARARSTTADRIPRPASSGNTSCGGAPDDLAPAAADALPGVVDVRALPRARPPAARAPPRRGARAAVSANVMPSSASGPSDAHGRGREAGGEPVVLVERPADVRRARRQDACVVGADASAAAAGRIASSRPATIGRTPTPASGASVLAVAGTVRVTAAQAAHAAHHIHPTRRTPMHTRAYGAHAADRPLEPLDIERRTPGARDVQIDIAYCGVCHSDLHTVRSEWAGTLFPCVPGHEIVGHVTAVGPASRASRRATPWAWAAWSTAASAAARARMVWSSTATTDSPARTTARPTTLRDTPSAATRSGSSSTSGSCSASRTPAEQLAAVAPLLCAGITTYSPLRHWKVGPGKKVGVVGIGGLGHVGVKLAHAMGAHTVAFTTSPGKRDDARALGADDVIVSRDGDEMRAHAGTFDLILDTVAASHDLDALTRLLKRDGTLVVVGVPEHAHPSPDVSALISSAARSPARSSAASPRRRRCSTSAPRRGSWRTSR
jgi:uncharacterized zinc-type alcohol dehydrogenase-like protein